MTSVTGVCLRVWRWRGVVGGGGRVVDGEVEAEDGVWNRGERVKQDLS